MPDELIGLAVAATVDVLIKREAKRRRWLRILGAIGSLLFLVFIGGVVYITVRYS